MKTFLRYASSFLAPVAVGLVIPYLILHYEHYASVLALNSSIYWRILGMIIGTAGLALFLATVRMFILIGKGTIMPWDPTRRLITGSLYAYVRNPMILSLILLVIGEAFLFGSYGIAILALFFFVLNTVYFKFSEEPGLVKRFGAEYEQYRRNVPMWIPRLRPWKIK